MRKPVNIAILASGKGSNADQLCRHFRNHTEITVKLIISNKSEAGVLEVAARNNIHSQVIHNHRLESELLEVLRSASIDFVVLAGFLRKVPDDVVEHFKNRMVNIHPALLPKFGGKGMYGSYVHSAVLAAGEKSSGITIHFVTGNYDEGNIVFQTECPVEENDTAESLADKIHALEHRYYPEVIEKLILNTQA